MLLSKKSISPFPRIKEKSSYRRKRLKPRLVGREKNYHYLALFCVSADEARESVMLGRECDCVGATVKLVSSVHTTALKVVGNEKVGGSGMCQSVPIWLRPRRSRFVSLLILLSSLIVSTVFPFPPQ